MVSTGEATGQTTKEVKDMKTIESFINEIECNDHRRAIIPFWKKLVWEELTADQIKNITAIANMMPSWALLEWDFDQVQYHIRHFCNMEGQHDLQTKVETVLFRIAGDYYFANFKKIG